jgi:CTP:molybdopterin cytidylyltransferase MocA
MAIKNKMVKPSHQAKTVTVTVQRTVQIRQYEPVVVTVSETHEVLEGESTREVRNAAYNGISASVVKYVEHEVENYSKD